MPRIDQKNDSKKSYAFFTIFLISCSMLMFEILLTRICALRFYFHFGFLIVSNCLLGIGASGSMIFVLQKTFAKRERFWIWVFIVFYIVSLIFTYIFLITYNIDRGFRFTSLESIVSFFYYNIVAAIPFFFAGSTIGLLLTFNAKHVNKVYGIDLLGAGLGCILCPFFLWQTGAGGCFIIIMLLALIGIMIASPAAYKRLTIVVAVPIGLLGVFLLPSFDKWFPVPSKAEIRITEKRGIEPQKNIIFSQWSTISRIDLVDFDQNRRFIFGWGPKGDKKSIPIPEEKFIVQDGSAGTYIVNFSEHPEALKILKQSLYSVGFLLKKNPRVFIIGVGGGNDVWAARANGAKFIKGIEINRQILDIHRDTLSQFSSVITNDTRIELIRDEGRSALMRDKTKYDVIQMTGVDTWTSLTSGAYVLAENYLYTTECFQTMYENLNDEGVIVVTRFAAEMETLRLFSNIVAAIQDRVKGSLKKSVMCIGGSDFLRTIVLKKGEFNSEEIDKLEQFSTEYGFQLIYHPEKTLGTFAEKFIRAKDRELFIHEFPLDISPTPDDRPYFFNYSKWSKLFLSSKLINAPVAIFQGNPLFILGQLTFSTVLALAFILSPLVFFMRKGLEYTYASRFLVYFTGLGLGFIAIEIVLMQKLVLFLGHPQFSITVTLFSMLVFAGIGSIISHQWLHSPSPRAWIVPLSLAVLLGLFILFSPAMVKYCIVFPKIIRILICAIVLAPISLLLGMPFAYGIQLLNRFNPTIIPWAWAVNGCMTVIGSILTVILSMNMGFNAVLMTAISVYLMSFFAIRKLT